MILHGHDFPDLPHAAAMAYNLGSRDPEDDAQDAYVRILESGYDRGRIEPFPFFRTILAHVVWDRLYSCANRRRAPIEGAANRTDGSRDTLSDLVTAETAARVRVSLNGTGRIIELLANGHKYREVARLTGLPLGTVKSRINRARERCCRGRK